jgi:SAM-dependent methyltransferase
VSAAPSPPAGRHAAEERRIRAAYAARPADDARYSWLDPSHVAAMQGLERAMLGTLRARGQALAEVRALEIGCGRGDWLQRLVLWGMRPEHVSGIDLLADRVADARRTCAPGVDVRLGNAASLPWPDATFDLVVQITAFSSILDPDLRARVAGEMRRVLRPAGVVLWYDVRLNNPRNRDVRAVGRRELARLFPDCRVDVAAMTLAPPLARRVMRRAPALGAVLTWLPWLRSHDFAAISPAPLGTG